LTAAGAAAPYWFSSEQGQAAEPKSPNERPHVAAVGMGNRGLYLTELAGKFGQIVAVCDVDLERAEKAKAQWDGKPAVYQDYRKLMERKDIDVVINATPDHWHTAINIAACKTGWDLYTEKPLTLTIDEGKLFRRVVRQTGRVVQVGTQQRSEQPFHLALELIRAGRIGKLQHVTVTLPFWSTTGGPFATQPVPPHLDWDLFQGQAPWREYCPQCLRQTGRGVEAESLTVRRRAASGRRQPPRRHAGPHGQLLRVHQHPPETRLRRRGPAPLGHCLSLGQHRHSPGARGQVGLAVRTDC